ncbi:MAG: hypothetical protein HFI70_03785 [Lachnospiraceae bacterium]|nr:hypothetical protein [Lachnospiraceae bacterium]
MAYRGYLFEFGNYTFPNKYIKFDTYDIAPDQRQDLNSFTDGNGVTNRNALEHTKTNITFTTIPMPEKAMDSILSNLEANYINQKETNANCTYFNPRKRTYTTGHFYLDPSVKFRIKKEDDNGKAIQYNETQWIFTEY